MKRLSFLVLFCLIPGPVAAEALWLGAPAELTLDAPWSQPVGLQFPSAGAYRLEATGLRGDPVEVVLEQGTGGVWKPKRSNRNLGGGLAAFVDFSVADGDDWRVRPAQKEPRTVVLRLKASAFAALRDSVKQDLTLSPEVSLPLRKRAELSKGTGGASVAAAAGPQGELWVGWLTEQGAEVWETRNNQRLPRVASQGTPSRLSLESGPVVTVRGQERSEAWVWSGVWQSQAVSPESLTTPWGVFRSVSTPPQVWRSTPAGWADLRLPLDRSMSALLLGSTDDGLYALLASPTSRAFYLWNSQGWQALPPPPATGAAVPALWAATSVGALIEVEAQGKSFTLRSFDGTEWGRALDLSSLAPQGVQALCLVGPSVWSRTGSLVVVTDRVVVYDLP